MLIGGILALLLGFTIIFMPQQYIKAEERNNTEVVAKMKKRGIAIIVCGVIILLCSFIIS